MRNLVTQGFARDGKDAAARALAAGLDMDMASGVFGQNLVQLVKDGVLREQQIDEAVRRILAVKVRLGLFEQPYADEARAAAVLAEPQHRVEARRAAQRSMVLLRNEKKLLPLPPSLTNVAVIGPLADSKADTEGSWMVFGHVPAAVTVLEGVRARLKDARVTHAPGPEIRREVPSFFEDFIPGPKKPAQTKEQAEAAFQQALETARGADLVIAVMGELGNMSGEAASRSSLDLPGRQEELLRAVVALGKPVVLVLIGGRPLSIGWAAENVPAILEAWQPGTEGGHAVADVLFGDVNPGASCPVTFPRNAGHAPLYYARNLTHQPEGSPRYKSRYWDGPTTPLYPFGYGLSYTTFTYSNLTLGCAPAQDRRWRHGVGGRGQHGWGRRRRGGAALRAPEIRERLAPGAGAQGVPAHRAEAGGDADHHVPARSRRAALLEHVPETLVAGRRGVRRLGRRGFDCGAPRRAFRRYRRPFEEASP